MHWRGALRHLGTVIGLAGLADAGRRVAADRDAPGPDDESDDDNAGRGNGKRAATIDSNLGYTQYDPDNIVPFENRVAETVDLNIRAGTYLLTDADGTIQTDPDGTVRTAKRAAPTAPHNRTDWVPKTGSLNHRW